MTLILSHISHHTLNVLLYNITLRNLNEMARFILILSV